MNTLIVVNGSAGSAGDLPLDEMRTRVDADVVRPRSVTSFRAEVTAAARGAERIIVAGGDGTFNSAVNAFDYRFDSIRWGLIPSGTGNDLARTLGLPADPMEAFEVAIGDHVRRVDVAQARGPGVNRLFVNACMGGFPVEVDEAATEQMKERFGPFAFWVAGAKAATRFDRTTVTVDGRALEDCVAVGVGNGRTAGGGIEVWPEADPSDGLLDACALAIPRVTSAAKLIPRLMRGTHEGIDEVSTARGRCIEIDSDPPIELNVDGDLVGMKTPVTFEVCGTLPIAVPG
jgi:diacylglycerol kinase (ATP)